MPHHFLQHVMVAVLPCMSFFVMNAGAHAQVDVLTQHNDNFRTGVNLQETQLTPVNVVRTNGVSEMSDALQVTSPQPKQMED